MRRIERTKPIYTIQSCKDWYKHNEIYKKGRRTDPTAGHIMKNMSGLLPRSLPPLQLENSKLSNSEGSENYGKIGAFSAGNNPVDSHDRVVSAHDAESKITGNRSATRAYRSVLTSRAQSSASLLSAILEPLNPTKDPSAMPFTGRKDYLSKTAAARIGRAGWPGGKVNNAAYLGEYDRESDDDSTESSSLQLTSVYDDLYVPFSSRGKETRNTNRSNSALSDDRSDDGYDNDPFFADQPTGYSSSIDDKLIILSRPFVIPFDSKNCIVQICCNKIFDETLTIRVLTTDPVVAVHNERSIHISKVYELVKDIPSYAPTTIQISSNEDVQALRAFLMNVFREVDVDNTGTASLLINK